jgi:hypothetical protein
VKTLTDLTQAQLTTAYGVIAGIPVKITTFNCRSKAQSRLAALLAERNLTEADALLAAGIADDANGHEVAGEPAAEPLPAEPDAAQTAEAAPAPTDADEPVGTNDADQPTEANDDAPVAPTAAEAPPPADPTPEALVPVDAATILTSNKVINDTRDWLVRYLIDSAGLEPETAVLAALRAVDSLKLPEPTQQPQPVAPRQPRTGTKQDIVIEMLRRPEGATIEQMMEATGWLSHTCRGVMAGALKKRLGLNVTSERVRMVGPNKTGAPGSYSVYKIA